MRTSKNKRKRTKIPKALCILLVGVMMLSIANISSISIQTKAETVENEDEAEETGKTESEEAPQWLKLYQSAKYRVTEVDHVVYCYFTEDCTGYGWLISAFGISSKTNTQEKTLLPCENRENLRIAGIKEEMEQYRAGELVASRA